MGEPKIAAHPHIVRLVGISVLPPASSGVVHTHTAIVLELCDGGDLLSVLRRSQWADSAACGPIGCDGGADPVRSVQSKAENDLSLELKLTLDTATLIYFANQIASALVFEYCNVLYITVNL